MRGCPYCGRANCIWANQPVGSAVPAGVPIVDLPVGMAGPRASEPSGFGALTTTDWLGGLVACAQGFLAGAATGAAIGAPAGGIGALPAALIGGAIGCVSGIGAFALAQFVAAEREKKEKEFVAQQSASYQAQVAEQQRSLQSGLAGGVAGIPYWVFPAAIAIVGIGFLARKKGSST